MKLLFSAFTFVYRAIFSKPDGDVILAGCVEGNSCQRFPVTARWFQRKIQCKMFGMWDNFSLLTQWEKSWTFALRDPLRVQRSIKHGLLFSKHDQTVGLRYCAFYALRVCQIVCVCGIVCMVSPHWMSMHFKHEHYVIKHLWLQLNFSCLPVVMGYVTKILVKTLFVHWLKKNWTEF